MLYFTTWSEKITNKGEDAQPTLMLDEEAGVGILAVYDGMGGAGAQEYQLEEVHPDFLLHIHPTYSGAYLASNLAKYVVEGLFSECLEAEDFSYFDAQKLKESLQSAFLYHIEQWDTQPSKIKSKLIKRLPTTLATLLFHIEFAEDMDENTYHIEAFWAGDSRCFVMTKEALKQISKDDLQEEPDALQNLLEDGIISNCINADVDFAIRHKSLSFQEPILLITATDGCFNYFPTPAHFEYLLLSCLYLHQTCTVANWQESVQEKIQEISGDDASLSLLTLGFGEDLVAVKMYFIERFQELKFKYIDPINALEHNMQFLKEQSNEIKSTMNWVTEKRDALRNALWEEYKKKYEDN